MKKQSGMTMIEILLTLSIAIVGMLAMTSIFLSLRRQGATVTQNFGKMLQVRNVAVNLSSNLSNYQINFSKNAGAPCSVLNANNGMPLVWEGSTVTDSSTCLGSTIGCPLGRAGFVIQPFPNAAVRGAYLVTLRMTHPVYTKGVVSSVCSIPDAEEYQFVVGTK